MSCAGNSSAQGCGQVTVPSSPRQVAWSRPGAAMICSSPHSVETTKTPVSATQPPRRGRPRYPTFVQCSGLCGAWTTDDGACCRREIHAPGHICGGPSSRRVRAIGPGVGETVQAERLTVRQTATGYWVVQRGTLQLAGAPTRHGAEAERELLRGLRDRRVRRAPRSRTAALSRK
jgi:hypothetical protein